MDINALILNCTLKKPPEPSYTQKTAKWMAHNVTHLARILKEHPIPPEGNTVPGWQPDDCSGHDDRMPGGHVG